MNTEEIRLEKVKDSLKQLPAMDTLESTKEALSTLEWVVKELRTIYMVKIFREKFGRKNSEDEEDEEDLDTVQSLPQAIKLRAKTSRVS